MGRASKPLILVSTVENKNHQINWKLRFLLIISSINSIRHESLGPRFMNKQSSLKQVFWFN